MNQANGFLPISRKEMEEQGIEQFDFIYISGDAYVDHPSFGSAIITRVVQNEGFTVGMISQPDWHSDKDFKRFGRPKYAFLVSSGNIDSMVAHYTVAKKKRSEDAYTAGGIMGKRPDRAVTVYCKKIRQIYGDVPIAIGGLEASLRRFAHYDYWDDDVKPSILIDSTADLLMYGMSEHQIVEIVNRMKNGERLQDMTDMRGICYLTEPKNTPYHSAECPSFRQVCESKEAYAKACKIQYDQQDEIYGKTIVQRHGDLMLVQTPPAISLSQEELDKVFALPYMRTYHPVYEELGGVPGIKEVEFSINHNRGCFGFCNFCSLALHQGRKVTARSEESILEEAKILIKQPGFKGYIHDVGGPSANFRGPSCDKQIKLGLCKGKKCLAPEPCPNLKVTHEEYLNILRKLRKLDGVKKVFIRSGIRYDYLIEDEDDSFMKELIEHHVSGQLKVAPEHCSAKVLDMMGKPHIEAYEKFEKKYYEYTKKIGKEQYLVPYLMSSHPGCSMKEAVEVAEFIKKHHIRPEQVQDFYPTPGTISTCMFYTGLDPNTMEKVYIPKDPKEKAMQRALLQYFRPENKRKVIMALQKAGRTDLIGNGKNCLVEPDREYLMEMQKKQAARKDNKKCPPRKSNKMPQNKNAQKKNRGRR